MPVWLRRILLVVLSLAALAALVAWFVLHRRTPRVASLLPPSEGVMYVDVGLLRKAGIFSLGHPIERDPEFEDFVKQTGFDFERDLDEVALALHSPATQGRGDDYPRFSWVFLGRIDPVRAAGYFGKLAQSTESYRGKTIFVIPRENRLVKVAMLDDHMAAVSNTETEDAIHAIVDRWSGDRPMERSASLLEQYYANIPVGSIAWAMARVASPAGVQPPMLGLTVPSWLRDVAGGSDVVASLRFVSTLQFRAVSYAPDEAAAQRISQSVSSWLGVFRALEGAPGPIPDPDVKSAFDSLRVDRDKQQVTLTAEVPAGALKKLAAETSITTQKEAPPQKGQKEKGQGKK